MTVSRVFNLRSKVHGECRTWLWCRLKSSGSYIVENSNGLDDPTLLVPFLDFENIQARKFKAAATSAQGCSLSLPFRKQPIPPLPLQPISRYHSQSQTDKSHWGLINPFSITQPQPCTTILFAAAGSSAPARVSPAPVAFCLHVFVYSVAGFRLGQWQEELHPQVI